MCGINGFNFESKKAIELMNNSIKHRGPDASGIFIDEISLGHRRLSIIDLSKNANQPMSNEAGDIIIVFNGEIYNFKEIKKELEEQHKFKSNSDTEVIIHAYEEWGEECVKKFNGMWAFCIYDKRKSILFLSRDRLGKKPLYYYLNKNKFIFSSEIKAILKHDNIKKLNKPAVSSFLSYRYVLGEETFFKDIFKLLPAYNLVFNLLCNKIEKVYEYWDLKSNKLHIDDKEAKKELDILLNKSIAYRKISDVPLGVILSGGLDSSIITAMLALQEKNSINTFTVKFKEVGFDETEFAKLVSKKYNSNYHEIILDASNFLEVMKEYIRYKDEPIGVPNEVALYLLSKKIKESVTVVLSGEGADELFEGYGRIFSSARDYEIMRKLQEENNIKRFKLKFSSLYKKYGRPLSSELEHFLFMYKYWTEEEKNYILKEDSKKDYSFIFKKYFNKHDMPYEKKISYVFLKLHLPALLSRLDSSTMASAVEARAPFLDFNLVNYAFNLPENIKTKWKISNDELLSLNKNCDELSENENTSKYILKEIAKNYLPETIVNRKKQGFPLPLDRWFKNKFLDIAKKYLLNKNAKIKNIINQDNLKTWMNSNEFRDLKKFGQKLWMLLSLELWLKEWFPEIA